MKTLIYFFLETTFLCMCGHLLVWLLEVLKHNRVLGV